MNLRDFLDRREAEREWAFANGLNNGNAETNGEFACLDMLLDDAGRLMDIGANEGLFIQRAVRRRPDLDIVAFEPNPAHGEGLKGLLAPVGGRLEAIALGDTSGVATLHVHEQHHATASLTGRPRMAARFREDMSGIEVPLRRLDEVETGATPAGTVVLKIDAEGYEFPILRGASEVLARHDSVAILFEFSFAWLESGESLIDCFNFLDSRGFDFYRLLPLGLERIRFFSNGMDQSQYCNYVALKNVLLDESRACDLATPLGRTRLHLFPGV